MACSMIRTPTSASLAISLSTVATPPRVGSRMNRTPGAASSSCSTISLSGAVSEGMSASRLSSPRAISTATPWSPILPDTMILSPGFTDLESRWTDAGTTPTPAVVM